ncbi:uncharacterized protein LOC133184383 [Saccostrea echinata]|uniref:uncharacterized protein LOC133184383 n=1 Tax=Saccostrea echinata TaxID=191078 RepID=UPI002A80095A|nr:uncharacterized protein LOC133184383 [Saccostrea echinata]
MSTMRRRSQTGPRTDTTHDIFVYMTLGRYPDGANENAKRNLRKRSKLFKLKGSELFHVSTIKDKFGKDVQRERLVLTDSAERNKVIGELHVDDKGNHLGREKVLSALSEKYYFVGMNNKVREYLLNCSSCRTRFKLTDQGMSSDGSVSATSDFEDMDDSDSNVSFSEDTKPIKSEWPARSQEALHFWDIVEMNVLGPYDCIDSKHYIIVFLDLFSNWPEAFVVDSVTPAVVTHLTLNLICRFGCMKTMMIRESSNYSKDDLTPLQKTLEEAGIDINVNPFSSALSDKIWKEIADNLNSFTTNNSHWPHCLEFALLPHRVSRAERSEYTPAYITYGRELNLPSSMNKGDGDNFPSAEPHLSLEDMTALTEKFEKAYSSYGKNIQAWNSCSQPFCVIPSLNSSEPARQPGKRGRKKKNPVPAPPPQEDFSSDKEAEEDMPPPATNVTPRTAGRKRKRNISRITRLINAENDDDEDGLPDQDPDDKDYCPTSKMVKVNTEQDGESPGPKPPLVMKLTPPTPKKHICNGCGKEFSRSDVLRRHIREMHETHESMINICPECGICIKRKHHLARHIKQVHSKGCECKACGEMFGNKVELKEHISTAHDGYNCEKCNRNYTSKSGLKFHIAQEHEQKYPCPICGKSSGSSSSFNKHLASHTEGADIKCPHCRYIFPNKDLFMAHRESCRISRAYTCSHCGKGFPSKNSFQHHEATHFDGKFPCHLCGIKFSFSTNLNRHIRTVHLAKTESEDSKQSDSSPDKTSLDQSGNLSEVEKTDNIFESGVAGGMEECHNNSLNQIVEAIKLQVERRISAGYCGNGETAGKQSVGTDAMETDEGSTSQKSLESISSNQLARQLTSSEKEPSSHVQQATSTKPAASSRVQEFALSGVSTETQKRPDGGNFWIALQDATGKTAKNVILGQQNAYQVDKMPTQVIASTENSSSTPAQVYSSVGKKTLTNTFSEPLSQISGAPESSIPSTYHIISDQSLISQLKSTASPSVSSYRVITTDRAAQSKPVLPNIYTVMTTDPTKAKATSILPSTYVAPTSEQLQLAAQKPQPIVIAAGQVQKSVPLTYTVQQPAATNVQKVPAGSQSELVSHIQKILPEAYSEVQAALLQKVQSGSFGLVTDENSAVAYSLPSSDDTNKDPTSVTAYNVVIKEAGATERTVVTEAGDSLPAASNAGHHVTENPKISPGESTDTRIGFSGTPADPVQETVQFSPELTTQEQEAVQYDMVPSNPELMTSDPTPDPYPSEVGDNSGTTYTVSTDSIQADEETKVEDTIYTDAATENVENLMQLSEPTQTNIAVVESEGQTVELDAYYQAIYKYKKYKAYMPGCPDNYKRVLRKSALSYYLFDDKLYYMTEGELRYVPTTWKERLYYLVKCHINGKGKHVCKNMMAQWMTEKKIVWKGISVDCTAFAAACPHCTLGEARTEPVIKSLPKDDPVLKMAEDNYSLLLNYLQKQTFPVKTLQSQVDAVTSIARQYMIQKGVLYFKKGKGGELRCLEVGTKDRKVAMQAAHVNNGEHLGPAETLRRLSEKFIWNKMADSVEAFVMGCCKKKTDEEPATPKSVLNRNVDFFSKQFKNGVVDKLLAGKETFPEPVVRSISELIKKEQETSERERCNEESGKEGSDECDKEQTEIQNDESPENSQNATEGTPVKVTRTEEGEIIGEVSDEMIEAAVRTILSQEEFEEKDASKVDKSSTSAKPSKTEGEVEVKKEVHKSLKLKCEVCGMLFKGQNKYKAHMYGHTGIKPYPCTLCDKSFTLKKTLKFHLGKHAGQRPFLCNICGKRFHVPNSLRSHLQIHAKGGNNIHYCKLCNREFATDVRYEKHLKFKHPPEEEEHLCSQCGKKFCSRKSLKRHERSAHDAVKNHFCSICDRGFFRKEYLNRHMQQHETNANGEAKKVKPLVIRKPKALQANNKPKQAAKIVKTDPENIIIETVEDGESSGLTNVVGNIRIEVEPGQIEEYYIQESEDPTTSTYYAVTETADGDEEGGGSTLVYSFPSVQYEIECPDGQLNSEALSAITMLAQASSQQNMLSRAKPAIGPGSTTPAKENKKKKQMPKVEDFLALRDYTGAITLLEFNRNSGKGNEETDMWIAYCAFHLGDYKRSMEEFERMTKRDGCHPDVWTNLACCYFFLGMYPEADNACQKGPKSKLQNRLLFHLSHKFGDEKRLMGHHQNLQDVIEDQLSLASIHYLRSHYQEAIDIYKRILLDNRDFLALNVYVALCYYKLDYYDVSQEVLAVYLQQYPDSAIALNLKACNHFRLYNGKAAEAELKSLQEMSSPSFVFARDLIKHNLVVFRGGEGALQVLPPLIDVIPEARLNLVIYYLKQDDIAEAYNLIKDLEPTTPQEYILKGVVNAAMGQEQGSREHLKIAQQYFQLVGGSASECDTIPGRQCMSSCFFLLKQFEDVLIYLNSIKSYFYNDDSFNFNYAQAKAAVGNFKEAEEVFMLIQSDKIKNDYTYLSWLARVYIMNRKSRLAWELYLKMETSGESFSLLQLIANDCYKMGQFYYAAKAFDVLERLDPNPEYWEGKRGACVGVFQMIIAGHEPRDTLRDVINMLRNTSNPQVEYIIRTMKKWAKENLVPLP